MTVETQPAPRRKRLVLLAASLVLVLAGILIFTRPMDVPSNAVSIAFIGFTNGGNLRFALLSISNQAPYSIGWRDTWSEVEGVQEHKARIINRNLPFRMEPELKSEHSMLIAVGEPDDPRGTGRWRFNMVYSQATQRERWWRFSLRHPYAAKIGRLFHLNTPGLTSQTNWVTVTSVWFTNAIPQ